MSTSPFGPLRASLFALLGLAACGGNLASSSELDEPDAGHGNTDGSIDMADASIDVGTADGEAEADADTSVCENPTPVSTPDGSFSGFVECSDGTMHRTEAVTVAPPAPGTCAGDEDDRYCETDADCTERPHGRCLSATYRVEPPQPDLPLTISQCGCFYGCTNDDDCGAGRACIPGGIVPTQPMAFCAFATCRTNDDCESGECGLSVFHDGCGYRTSLGCRTPGDECRTDADCDAVSCRHLSETGWTCQGMDCMPGRPLLVAGRARKAPAESRADWSSSLPLPDTTNLAPELRRALATHWLEVAAMEHASVGSFARFSLQLLALGAPPDLLADAQQAALDEVEHARMAYGLASAYAGRSFGPGALDMSGVELVTCRREALRSLIVEACVNETVGVAEALAIADRVSDPALATVHRRIAEDERRHAELAWRTLAWLLETGDDELLDEAARAFAEATAAMEVTSSMSRAVAPEHGLLSADELLSLRRQALREVVTPCATGLLDRLKMAA